MRIREAMAKLIAQLERARRVKGFSRGRELWSELAGLLAKVPKDRFGYELRMAGGYKAWLEQKDALSNGYERRRGK